MTDTTDKTVDTGKTEGGNTDTTVDTGKTTEANDKVETAAAKDWRDGLTGEELETAKRLASPHDAVKSVIEGRKLIGSMIRIPGKDAKPEDIAKFKKALGAPEKAEDYKFPAPEGREETDSEKALASKIGEVLHKHNVPLTAAGELHGVVKEAAQAIEAENERLAVEGRATSEAALRKEWGADFEGNVQLSARAAHAFGGDGFKQFLNSTMVNGVKLGDHPEFMRVFGKVGRRMGEGDFIGAVGADQVKGLDSEIAAKTAEMHTAHQKGDRAATQALNKELLELQAKRHGSAPIVGSQGRAV